MQVSGTKVWNVIGGWRLHTNSKDKLHVDLHKLVSVVLIPDDK